MVKGDKINQPENEGGNYGTVRNSTNRCIHKISPPIRKVRWAKSFSNTYIIHLHIFNSVHNILDLQGEANSSEGGNAPLFPP